MLEIIFVNICSCGHALNQHTNPQYSNIKRTYGKAGPCNTPGCECDIFKSQINLIDEDNLSPETEEFYRAVVVIRKFQPPKKKPAS